MKMKFLSIKKYISNIFSGKGKKEAHEESVKDDSLKKTLNRFLGEGFSFWLDPYHYFRKNFVTRAGPMQSITTQ